MRSGSISPPGCSAIGIVRASDHERMAVEFAAPPRCKGCGGACFWYRVPPSQHLTLAGSGKIPVGATVAVTLPDRYLLLGAALVYGLPLAGLLAGAAAAAALFETDLAVAAGAALTSLLGVLVASSLRRRVERATLQHLDVRRVS